MVYAARLGSLDIIKYMMKLADFTEITNIVGNNTLFSATGRHCSRKVVITLLEGGFPIECRNNTGQTALHYAIEKYLRGRLSSRVGPLERRESRNYLHCGRLGRCIYNIDTKDVISIPNFLATSIISDPSGINILIRLSR